MNEPLIYRYKHMSTISSGIDIPLKVYSVDEARRVFRQQLFYQQVMLGLS